MEGDASYCQGSAGTTWNTGQGAVDGNSGANIEGISWVTGIPCGRCQVQEKMPSGARGSSLVLLRLWAWGPSQGSAAVPALITLRQQAWRSTPCRVNPSENKCFQKRTLGLLINCPISGSSLFRVLGPRRPGPLTYPLTAHACCSPAPWVC